MGNEPADKPFSGTGEGRRGAHDTCLNDLYQRYWGELSRYVCAAFRVAQSDAEDIAQETFAKFAALDSPEEIHNPRAFLYRMAHNAALNQRRKTSVQDRYSQAVLLDVQQENLDYLHGERVLLAEERFRIFDDAIKQLSQKKRRLLILHRVHNLSYAEISRRTGISQTQAKRLVAQALAECKGALDAAYGEKSGTGANHE